MPILRWIDQYLEEFVCGVAITVVAVSVFLQVIMRYIFNSALQWTEEVAAIGMVWAVYMGASLCIRERFHIRIMAAVMLLPRRMARAMIIFSDLLWLAFCVTMVVVSVEYLTVMYDSPSYTPRLQINEFYSQSILFIAYALMVFRIVQIYVAWFRSGMHELPGMRDEHQGSLEEV